MLLFEGTISCKSVLESKKRKSICLYVDQKKRTKDFSYIIHLAKKQNVSIQFLSREELNDIASSNKHGGILLEAENRKIPSLSSRKEGFICYINGVEDPYNLGSVCRNLYAAGCQFLILPRRDWSMSESTLLKASAGAYEKMNIFMIESDDELVRYSKSNDIPLICAYRKDAVGLYSYPFPNTFCLCIGGALRGLSASIIQASSQNVMIEYDSDFRNALDTPSATAVMAFEVVRQRKEMKQK